MSARLKPCPGCGSIEPCATCRGRGLYLYNTASGPAWGDCGACFGTGHEHGDHRSANREQVTT